MATKNRTPQRRAIGIVRVSRVSGREGESFASPDEQRQRIEAACARDGLKLVQVFDELDVSGGTPLERRTGLRTAVEAVEAGEANFDRLVRSLRVQSEVVQRVEAAGGEVLALDVGQVTEGTAGRWLSGTMLGAVSEYQRRTTRERTAGVQARAVARGATPWARVALGYDRSNGTPSPKEVAIVRRAFKMRAEGESVTAIRKMLKKHHIERSHRGVQVMLANRIYLGEIHFGKLVNFAACERIIDRVLWDRVQRMVIPRGPQPASTRLLSRLGILRCGSCGAQRGGCVGAGWAWAHGSARLRASLPAVLACRPKTRRPGSTDFREDAWAHSGGGDGASKANDGNPRTRARTSVRAQRRASTIRPRSA
jgi:site-specific DNA recombinase